ncbi:MAG: tRNA (N(6)-L-threonylcarbamoyladenosine(37)-C(2))-methylthiotransferase MtaB [Acutalibacteraceae bacterium]
MNFSIITLGCKVNQYESQVMSEIMQNAGFTLSENKDIADIFIVNTCTVTSVGDRKNRKLLHRIRRNNEDSIIVVTGCMPQAYPDEEIYSICDIILGNTNRRAIANKIKEYISNRKFIKEVKEHTKGEIFEEITLTKYDERTRAILKIEDGCNRFCSYCIIPYARGRVRSKDLDVIKAESEKLAKNGYKEIVLVGINLSCYGLNKDFDLCDAVEAVSEVEGVSRIRLGSLEPERMDEDFIKRLAKCKKLCPQFHLSLQSGCDETLARMNRHYSSEEYKVIVENLKKYFPDASFTTDVMVGFAGETEEEFKKSMDFVKEIGFSKVHVFPYSIREGTVGAALPNQVDEKTKSNRSKEMIALSNSIRNDYLISQVEKTYEVLFERMRENSYLEGYTKNYLPVRLYTDKDLSGEILNVKITDAGDDYCVCELI